MQAPKKLATLPRNGDTSESSREKDLDIPNSVRRTRYQRILTLTMQDSFYSHVALSSKFFEHYKSRSRSQCSPSSLSRTHWISTLPIHHVKARYQFRSPSHVLVQQQLNQNLQGHSMLELADMGFAQVDLMTVCKDMLMQTGLLTISQGI